MTSSIPDFVVYILGILLILELAGLFIAVQEINRADYRIKSLELDKKYLEERLTTRMWYSNNLRIVRLLREGDYSIQTIQRKEFQILVMETAELYEKIKTKNQEISNDPDMDIMENFYNSLLLANNSKPS